MVVRNFLETEEKYNKKQLIFNFPPCDWQLATDTTQIILTETLDKPPLQRHIPIDRDSNG